jgi:hypothetical protein
MSKLLKELGTGENQERLARLLQETQGLERGSRRARQSAGGLSDPRRPAIPTRGTPQSNLSSTPTRKPKVGKPHTGKPSVGDLPLGQELLQENRSDTPETGSEKPKVRIKFRVASSSQPQSPQETPIASPTAGGTIGREESLPMASQRNRPGRGGPRGATNDLTEEKDLWQQILPHLAAIAKAETRAAELNKEIFENEAQKKEKTNAGISILLFPIQLAKC